MSPPPISDSSIPQVSNGDHNKWLVMTVVALGTVAAILTSSGFNVAVPALMTHFGLGNDSVQLVVTVFMLANTVAMLPSPWLIERFGLRHCFLAAIFLLAVGSILGAISPNFYFLLGMRVLQGCAAGMLMPMGAIIVMHWFPFEEQGRASGILGFGVVLAPSVAPAIGGLLIDHFGWQAVFLMSLPFCALAWPGALRHLPNDVASERHDFDWAGSSALFVMTVTLLGFASTIHGMNALWWSSAQALLALASLVWFLRHARDNPHAIVKLAVFAHKPAAMGLIVSFVFGFGVYGSSYLIPVYLQTVLALSATQAGGVLIPGGLVLAASMPISGWISDRTDPRLVSLGGLLLLAISFIGMWHYSAGITYLALLLLTALGRFGIGMISASLNQATLHGLHGSLLGQLAMLISYLRMLGGFLGVALVAVFVEWRTAVLGGSAQGAAQAFDEAFLLSTLIMLLAMLATWHMKAD